VLLPNSAFSSCFFLFLSEDHLKCELGRWIYGDSKRFQSSRNYSEAQHKDFHAKAGAIIKTKTISPSDGTDDAPILSNNYGRSDMKKNGGSPTWTNIGLDKLDGASITSSNWGSQSWWTDTAGWDFTKVWQWGSNNLPILRNMPGTATQNPAVK
jgi:hypothetical protein